MMQASQPLQVLFRALLDGEDHPAPLGKQRACFREAQLPRAAFEKRHPQLILQLPDGLADGRLADEQCLSGARKTHAFSDHGKDAQQVQFHSITSGYQAMKNMYLHYTIRWSKLSLV